jgi:hypothetical protein
LEEYYVLVDFMEYPLVDWMAIYMFVNKLCIVLPVVLNFFVFYFMVRDSFRTTKLPEETTLLDNDIQKLSIGAHSNKEIDNYLT